MKVTITGIDLRTDIAKLVDLVARYPAVEIGLLYSAKPEGGNRYPSRHFLMTVAQALSGRCALHVCGSWARQELLQDELAHIVSHTPRVQVNGRVTPTEAALLSSKVGILITQHNDSNEALLSVPLLNHEILVDGSGGKGISPKKWQHPATQKRVGFAGGLGPDNLESVLTTLSLIARSGWWVDMEQKLRRDDWFDVESAMKVVKIFHDSLEMPR